MDARERQEASRAFSDTLRAKWAERRREISTDALMRRGGAEQDTAPGGQSEDRADEGEGKR